MTSISLINVGFRIDSPLLIASTSINDVSNGSIDGSSISNNEDSFPVSTNGIPGAKFVNPKSSINSRAIFLVPSSING